MKHKKTLAAQTTAKPIKGQIMSKNEPKMALPKGKVPPPPPPRVKKGKRG